VCYEKFKKYQQRNVEEWLQIDVCEVGFQHRQTLPMLPQNRRVRLLPFISLDDWEFTVL
jgi:hypothetical protein